MKTFQSGPSGGHGGKPFIDDNIPQGSRLAEIRIRAGSRLDAIQIVLEASAGDRFAMPAHGGNGGTLEIFTLDSDEFITGISGRYGSKVDCIRIQTNKQSSPTWGGAGGDADFTYLAPSGSAIGGFVGRAGDEIDAIGVLFYRQDKHEH